MPGGPPRFKPRAARIGLQHAEGKRMRRTGRGALRLVWFAAIAGAAIGISTAGCEDPLAPFNEISATSGAAQPNPDVVPPHSHRATIAARDVNDPPVNGVTLTTTGAGNPSHVHTVRLTAAQLQDLQQNMAIVNIASSPPDMGGNHFHTFLFER